MWVVRGVTTISKGAYMFITRGMPGAMHVKVGSVPCPPAAWSLRFASKIARYSGVNGADLASAQRGWVVRSHWLLRSGYLDSSKAQASAAVNSAAAAAAYTSGPRRMRKSIIFLPRMLRQYISGRSAWKVHQGRRSGNPL